MDNRNQLHLVPEISNSLKKEIPFHTTRSMRIKLSNRFEQNNVEGILIGIQPLYIATIDFESDLWCRYDGMTYYIQSSVCVLISNRQYSVRIFARFLQGDELSQLDY